jgi:murein L,D-transpeptidase YafK
MNYESFKAYKTRVFNKKEKKKIIFKNITLVPYPGNEKLFKLTFKEYYSSNSFSFEGDKVLILDISDKNHFKIITEQ